MPGVESAFNVQKDKSILTISASTSWGYAREWATKQEGDKGLLKDWPYFWKENLKGNKILVSWTCKDLGHDLGPKREEV